MHESEKWLRIPLPWYRLLAYLLAGVYLGLFWYSVFVLLALIAG